MDAAYLVRYDQDAQRALLQAGGVREALLGGLRRRVGDVAVLRLVARGGVGAVKLVGVGLRYVDIGLATEQQQVSNGGGSLK